MTLRHLSGVPHPLSPTHNVLPLRSPDSYKIRGPTPRRKLPRNVPYSYRNNPACEVLFATSFSSSSGTNHLVWSEVGEWNPYIGTGNVHFSVPKPLSRGEAGMDSGPVRGLRGKGSRTYATMIPGRRARSYLCHSASLGVELESRVRTDRNMTSGSLGTTPLSTCKSVAVTRTSVRSWCHGSPNDIHVTEARRERTCRSRVDGGRNESRPVHWTFGFTRAHCPVWSTKSKFRPWWTGNSIRPGRVIQTYKSSASHMTTSVNFSIRSTVSVTVPNGTSRSNLSNINHSFYGRPSHQSTKNLSDSSRSNLSKTFSRPTSRHSNNDGSISNWLRRSRDFYGRPSTHYRNILSYSLASNLSTRFHGSRCQRSTNTQSLSGWSVPHTRFSGRPSWASYKVTFESFQSNGSLRFYLSPSTHYRNATSVSERSVFSTLLWTPPSRLYNNDRSFSRTSDGSNGLCGTPSGLSRNNESKSQTSDHSPTLSRRPSTRSSKTRSNSQKSTQSPTFSEDPSRTSTKGTSTSLRSRRSTTFSGSPSRRSYNFNSHSNGSLQSNLFYNHDSKFFDDGHWRSRRSDPSGGFRRPDLTVSTHNSFWWNQFNPNDGFRDQRLHHLLQRCFYYKKHIPPYRSPCHRSRSRLVLWRTCFVSVGYPVPTRPDRSSSSLQVSSVRGPS